MLSLVLAPIGTPVSVTASPNPCTGQAGTTTVTSSTCSTSVSGGVTPYTYSWTYLSGDSRITADTPLDTTTTFTSTGMLKLELREAVYRCTVTDAAGGSDYINVTVQLLRLS